MGVGSIGTSCTVCLFMSADDDPLFLQVKEARASVLEPYAGKSLHSNHGQRVVVGQRIMQAATDMFLGWTARMCAHALARAHARSGDAAMIAGYMGSGQTFDDAIGEFAVEYADQNSKDYRAFIGAIRKKRIEASFESETLHAHCAQ